MFTAKGATIHELNTVRKHFSQIKGGKLVKKIMPAQLVSLIISDVVGDDAATIASGLTAPDKTTWSNVNEIIMKYDLQNHLPEKTLQIIKKGCLGEIEETLKGNEIFLDNVINIIIASNLISCQSMKKLAEQKGLKARIVSTELQGEARIFGNDLGKKLLKIPNKTVLIVGGETTVTIKGKGTGGRNQELALAASQTIKNTKNLVIAAIGSDGIDGPTDAAGAIVDALTLKTGMENGLNVQDYLDNNDSYNYLIRTNNLIKTGLTGTNVGDLIVALKYDDNIHINKK